LKRTRPHEIDDEARSQFHNVLPASWVIRDPQSHDYGIDAEVEIFRDGKSTGIILKVQLKGTEELKTSQNGETVSFQISVAHAKYFCEELNIPVVLVLADVKNHKTYWYAPQIDLDLCVRLRTAIAGSRNSIVIHFPVKNVLPDTLPLFQQTLTDCMSVLATRYVIAASTSEYACAFPENTDFTNYADKMQEKTNIFCLRSIERLLEQHDYPEAEKRVEVLLRQTNSSIETRFQALFYKGRILAICAPMDEGRGQYLAASFMHIGKEMRRLAHKGPLDLKCYAAMMLCVAPVFLLAEHDYGLYLNSLVTKKDKDTFWGMLLMQQRTDVAKSLVRKYNQVLRLINFAVLKESYHIIPRCVLDMSIAFSRFVTRLWAEGLKEAAGQFRASLLRVIDFSATVSLHCQQWELQESLLMCTLGFWDVRDRRDIEERISWVRQRILSIRDLERQNTLLQELERQVARLIQLLPNNVTESLTMDIETEKQAYRQMAASIGFNLKDPNDPFAEIVNIGLNDLNPERVLKNCVNLFVSLGTCGLPGQILKLPTAGSKWINCVLHRHAIGGMILDDLYESFRGEYCDKCPDRQPHPLEWKWSHAWQDEQNKLHLRDNNPEMKLFENSGPPKPDEQ